jgi:23S rRNA (guanosine2251-2'-O)-methyltransferase
MGSEGHGIGQLLIKNCDYLVKIPQYGNVNSLNVSVATGIIANEIIKQKKE